MDKQLFLIRNILFSIVVAFIIFYFTDAPSMNPIYSLLLYLIISILIILIFKQHKKEIKYIKYNNLYNITFIYSMVYILIVIIRSIFDDYLFIKTYAETSSGVKYLSQAFFASNLPYIVLIMAGLLLYNIVLIKQKK